MIPCTIFSKDGPNNSFSSPLQYECGFPAIKCGYTLSHSVISDLCDPMDCSTPLSMGLLRQEYWSGLPFPSPEDLTDPGVGPPFLVSPTLTGRFFTTAPPRGEVYFPYP